jgi:hypothetical protein
MEHPFVARAREARPECPDFKSGCDSVTFFKPRPLRLVLLLDKECPKNKTPNLSGVWFTRLALRLLV